MFAASILPSFSSSPALSNPSRVDFPVNISSKKSEPPLVDPASDAVLHVLGVRGDLNLAGLV